MKPTKNELFDKIADEKSVHKFIFETAIEGYCLYDIKNLDSSWLSNGLKSHLSKINPAENRVLAKFENSLRIELVRLIGEQKLGEITTLINFSFDSLNNKIVSIAGAIKVSKSEIAIISIGEFESVTKSEIDKVDISAASDHNPNQFDFHISLLDSSESVFLLKVNSGTGLINYANLHYAYSIGIDRSELLKKRFFENMASEDVNNLKSAIEDCVANVGKRFTRTSRCIAANQELIKVEWELFGAENKEEKSIEVVLIGIDITSRYKTDERLKEERDLLRTIIDIAPINIYALDQDGRKILANNSEVAFLGAKNEAEVIGKHDEQFFSEKLLKNKMGRNHEIIESAKPVFFEGQLPNSKGEFRRLTGSKSPFFNEKNEVMGLVGISIDITDRYLVEVALKKSEAQFRFIAENISRGIKIIENDLTVYVSPRFEKLFGYSAQEHIESVNEDFFKNVHPEDLEQLKAVINTAMESGDQEYFVQYRYLRKDGQYVWREDSVSINTDNKSGVQRVVILTADITNRRKDDELLQFIKFSLENTFDGILWINEDGSLYFVNNTACQMLGYSQSELLGKVISNIDKARRGKYWSLFFNELKQKRVINSTAKFLKNDGSYLEVAVNANFIEYKGKCYNCSFIKDITQDIKNEEALRLSNEMLRIVSNLSNIGGWTLNLLSQTLDWTEVTKRIMEVPEDYEPTISSAIDFYENKKKIRNLIYRAIQKGKAWKSDHKIITAKGKEIWVESIGNVEIVNGRVINLYGSIQDITDKKLAEIELERKNKLLEIIAKGTQQLLHSDDFISNLNAIIGPLGVSLNLDRVYLFRANYRKSTLSTVTQILEWCTDGVEPQIDNQELQDLPVSYLAGYFDILLKEETFYARVKDITNEGLKELFESQDIKSVLIFPLFCGDKFWGFMGFDDCKTDRIWKSDEFAILNSFASTLSHALTKKSVEDKIKESQNLLQKLTDNIPGAVFQFELTRGNKIIFPFISKGISKLIDLSQVKVENENFDFAFKFIHPDDLEGFRQSVLISASGLSDWDREFRIISREEVKWFRASSVPERREDNSIVWYGYIQDINESKLKKESLNKLVEITADQNQRLLNFAYIISHNIRSHTSNISSLLSIWQLAADQSEQELYLSMLHQSMEKLEETIYNLNQIITIQRETNLPRLPLSLKKEVERAVMSVSSDISKFGAQIDILIPSEITVKVIPAYLDSILINLITNALKYRSHDRALIVKITVKKEGKTVLLQVTDNGKGIDIEKYGSKIFGLYKTFHGNDDARGVGLFLVKNQIESMQGKIEVESEVGVGSTFKIFFNDEE